MAKTGGRPAPSADFGLSLERLLACLDGREIDGDGGPSRIEWFDDFQVPRVPIEVVATGPKVIDIAACRADRIYIAVGADTGRLRGSVARAGSSAEATGRVPDSLRSGAFINCVIHTDCNMARNVAADSIQSLGRLAAALAEAS